MWRRVKPRCVQTPASDRQTIVIELRTLTDADLPALRQLDDWAFGEVFSDSRWDVASAMLERPRQIGAFCADGLVGHTAAFTMRLTVPGASVPVAGVTWVGVSPGYRRRGVMSSLVNLQIEQLHEGGEPVAALWAAEPGIYGRFGFGVASRTVEVTVERGTVLHAPSASGHTLRLGDAAELLDACVGVYEQERSVRAGMVTRSQTAWQAAVHEEADRSGERSTLRCVVAVAPDGTPDGYVWFRTRTSWQAGVPGGTVEVAEVLATSSSGLRALLDVVLDLDLMSSTHLWSLPVDHPLLTWTQHSRRLAPATRDQLWVRLVRLDEALAARRYSVAIDIVLDVADKTCPWNAGRWQLTADENGAQVQRTSAPADLVLDVRDLGAAYLGDDTLHRSIEAGALTELTPGAALALARAMRADRAPWCAYMF